MTDSLIQSRRVGYVGAAVCAVCVLLFGWLNEWLVMAWALIAFCWALVSARMAGLAHVWKLVAQMRSSPE